MIFDTLPEPQALRELRRSYYEYHLVRVDIAGRGEKGFQGNAAEVFTLPALREANMSGNVKDSMGRHPVGHANFVRILPDYGKIAEIPLGPTVIPT